MTMMLHETFAQSAAGGLRDRRAIWPLSSSQSRIWRLSETGNEHVYGRQILAAAFHPVSLSVARETLQRLLLAHPQLSRRFEALPGGIVHQSINHPASVDRVECPVLDGNSIDDVVAGAVAEERLRPIDVRRDNTARFILFSRADQAVAILFSLHPLIGDLTALDRLASEFVLDIHALDQPSRESTTKTPATPVPPRSSTALVDYWYDRLSAQDSIALLQQETQAGAADGEAHWTEHAVEIIHEDAHASGDPADTASSHLLAALAITLRRYSACGTQRLGLVRRAPEIDALSRAEDLLVLATAIDGNMSLRQVQEVFVREMAAAEEQFVPFETLAEAMLQRNELFDTTSLAKTILDIRPAPFSTLP
ncbi:MAG TPA: non-ribosomal peptide synthetase, partial [Sinorhizobium sp.]|nr:non-ribosomal peptide synthetase [Sinorhizobium sp.]